MKPIKVGVALAECSLVCSVAAIVALAALGVQAHTIKWGEVTLVSILLVGAGSLCLRLRARQRRPITHS